MRVLIIRNAFQHDFGGAETYALNLAIALKNEKVESLVVTRVTQLLEKCHAQNIKTVKGLWYGKQGWGRVYRLWGPIVTLWYVAILWRLRIDVVHAQSRDDFLFATKAAQLLHKKVIWTDHGDLKYIMDPAAADNLRGRILGLATYARAIIAVSSSEKESILKSCPSFPGLQVIHNGIFPPGKLKQISHNSKYVIGATSRLVKAKGIAELIQAFSEIKLLNDSELWLIGEGHDRDELVAQAVRLGISGKVNFLGHQNNVWPYLASLDIFVHPSYHEAFSLSIIEAAMAGKPIIATDTGGNPEIVGRDVGILVPVKDSGAIKAAIDTMLDNSKLRMQLGVNAQELASTQFEFQTIVKNQVVPLYNN